MNKNTSIITARRLGTAGVGLLLALGVTGCGALAEEAIEQAIEADSGESVEIDFDGEDGTLSIEGENGEEFSIDVNEDGDGGSVMSSTDEDGNTFEMVTGEGLPDAWPGDVPEPPGTVVSSTIINEDDVMVIQIVADLGDSADDYDRYIEDLTNSGFTTGSVSTIESDGSKTQFTEVTSSGWTGQVTGVSDGQGSNQLSVFFQEVTE